MLKIIDHGIFQKIKEEFYPLITLEPQIGFMLGGGKNYLGDHYINIDILFISITIYLWRKK